MISAGSQQATLSHCALHGTGEYHSVFIPEPRTKSGIIRPTILFLGGLPQANAADERGAAVEAAAAKFRATPPTSVLRLIPGTGFRV